ncbi:MAG: hypothetical protein ACI4LA_04560 [Emergencia sp.]
MTVTIDVKSALIFLLLAALIVLVVYLIIIARNLVKTIKETNKILEDASVISGVAAEKSVQIDGIVSDVQSAVSDLSQAVKGQQNMMGAAANLVKALGSLVAIFKKAADGEEDKEADGKKKRK